MGRCVEKRMVRPSTAAILIEITTSPITGFPYVYLEKKIQIKCHIKRLHVLKMDSHAHKLDFTVLFSMSSA